MKTLFLAFTFCILLNLSGTHSIGSQFEYQYIGTLTNGDRQYKLTLVMSRDCGPGSIELANQIEIGIYNDQNSTLFKALSVNLSRLVSLSTCYGYCIQEGIYEATIELPPNAYGYHVMHSVCCRKESKNIRLNQSGQPDIGTMTYCHIPGNTYNSSAFFSADKYLLCKPSLKDTIDFFTFDQDGDSIIVSISPPYLGATISNNYPHIPATFPGLIEIPPAQYEVGYNSTFPLGISSTFTCDNQAKRIVVMCNGEGLYTVAYSIKEFRNGVLIATTIRETVVSIANFTATGKPIIKLKGFWTDQPKVALDWSAYCTGDVKKQYVQRSTNNVSNFNSIDSLPNALNFYTDASIAMHGTYYYRIRSVRKSGQIIYSDTFNINLWPLGLENGISGNSLSIAPVPIDHTCYISLQNDFIKNFVVTDQTGRIFYMQTLPEETNTFKLDCILWQSGIYYLQVTSASGELAYRKIVKL